MTCPDQIGLVATVTDFLHCNQGNIITLDQNVDKAENQFFMRIEWDLEGFSIPTEKIDDYFGTLIGQKHQMKWSLHFTDRRPRAWPFL